MQFVIHDFRTKEAQWKRRMDQAELDDKPGRMCYAAKQARMWHSMGEQAEARFKKVCLAIGINFVVCD